MTDAPRDDTRRERLSSDRAVRLLRAKVSELERDALDRREDATAYLIADLALIAGLLADEIERRERISALPVDDARAAGRQGVT